MKGFLVRVALPFLLTLLPVLAGIAVLLAIPPQAMSDYLARLRYSHMDWLILGLGSALFVAQSFLAIRALRWQATSFDERADPWLSSLAQAAEWFPLLGLLGTVAAILQTFSSMNDKVTPHDIIQRYAPAITATGSGLFMALLNILPTWVVTVGRQLILSLASPADADEPQA